MMNAEKVATSGIRGKLQNVQRVCEDGGEAVSSTIIDVIELAFEDIEVKRKIATMSGRQMFLEAGLVEIRAAGRTMRSQMAAAEDWIKNPKAQLTDAHMALEKLIDRSA